MSKLYIRSFSEPIHVLYTALEKHFRNDYTQFLQYGLVPQKFARKERVKKCFTCIGIFFFYFFFSLPISKSVCSRRLLKYCFFCLTLAVVYLQPYSCCRLHSQHNSLACSCYKEDTSQIFFKMRFFLLLHLWDIEFKLDLGHIQAIFHEIGSKYSILHVL